MFERAHNWMDKLNALQRTLKAKLEDLIAEVKEMNAAWVSGAPAEVTRLTSLPLPQLERLYRDFSYLGRWIAQIQERLTLLSF